MPLIISETRKEFSGGSGTRAHAGGGPADPHEPASGVNDDGFCDDSRDVRPSSPVTDADGGYHSTLVVTLGYLQDLIYECGFDKFLTTPLLLFPNSHGEQLVKRAAAFLKEFNDDFAAVRHLVPAHGLPLPWAGASALERCAFSALSIMRNYMISDPSTTVRFAAEAREALVSRTAHIFGRGGGGAGAAPPRVNVAPVS